MKFSIRIGVLCAALTLVLASSASAATTPADPNVEQEEIFHYTGGSQYLVVPAGVRSIRATAIGGRGAPIHGKPGGDAAFVTGVVGVVPGSILWVLVGGNATGTEGAFNGGQGRTPFGGYALGGGGGGASDVRTIAPGEPESLASRLLVAAGGGGAGGYSNGSNSNSLGANGAGGNAGGPGESAESQSPARGGGGGRAGTSNAGGAGGEGGRDPNNSGCGTPGGSGESGSEGQGGQTGAGPANMPVGWGGGGGGGLYGGGGGGAGTNPTCFGSPKALSGGGGGGGSDLVPPGGEQDVDISEASTPEIFARWVIPGTVMSGPSGYTQVTEPTFELSTPESAATSECRLDATQTQVEDEEGWSSCTRHTTLSHLADGSHRFESRAVDKDHNFDPTPATLEFTVDTTAPVVSTLSGPSLAEPTTETSPTFTFSATDATPVTYKCAFDGATPAPCTGAGSDRPAAPLALGDHTFSVTPTDAAGNVGATRTQSFAIVAPSSPPSSPGPTPPSTTPPSSSSPPATSPSSGGSTGTNNPSPPASTGPTIRLGAVKIDAQDGTAVIEASVDGPGRLRLTGPDAKPSSATARGADTVPIDLAVTGKGLARLKRTGVLTVPVTVTFTSAAGGTDSATKKVTLRWKGPTRAHPHR